MIVELTNHYIEASAEYDVEHIQEQTYGNKIYFKFYFGKGKWSKEYSTPTYSYRIIK